MIKVSLSNNRICQGDIYRNVEYIESVEEIEGELIINKILFPLAIVLTQDCDLDQDFTFRNAKESDAPRSTDDKLILSILVAPLYNAEHLFKGEHLSELKLSMQVISKNKSPGSTLKQNSNPRYQYIEFENEKVPIPPAIIDFKHYFSVGLPQLMKVREKGFVCQVSELYREDISQRFSSFLSRIGLP